MFPWIPIPWRNAKWSDFKPSERSKSTQNTNIFFNRSATSTQLLQIMIISTLWCWKMDAKCKWSNFSKSGQYFLIICVELKSLTTKLPKLS